MQRLARFIRLGQAAIASVTITLDSHHHVGIERPAMWRKADGSPIDPFTQLGSDDVRQGRFVPRDPAALESVLAYLEALEAAGRYTHMVWPTHCEIGTWGHNLHADVLAACNAWEQHHGRSTAKVLKGSNPYTEHYSAFMAEVPDPDDVATQFNQSLFNSLKSSSCLLVAGEAGSHCVKSTLEHYAQHVDDAAMARVALLTDCMSPIPGFEPAYDAFLAAMEGRGARLLTTTAWLSQQGIK